LRDDLADQEKQLQVMKSKLEAAEVAREYLKSKGLEAAEYKAFRENHATQEHTGFGAEDDDVTEKRGRDGFEGDENGEVADGRDPKR
jgi:hypothetical protein